MFSAIEVLPFRTSKKVTPNASQLSQRHCSVGQETVRCTAVSMTEPNCEQNHFC